MLGRHDCLVLELSLYTVCFFDNFGGDGCSGTDTQGRPKKMLQCLGQPSELVQDGVQQLLIVELIPMEMWDEGKKE